MLLGRKIIGTIGIMSGIPSLPEPFSWSLLQMSLYNSDYLCEQNEQIHYEKATISFHAAARNDLVNRMHGEWLLLLDTDHQFDPDLAARMLFCMNKYKIDVLTGIYTHKAEPHIPVIYRYEKGKGFNPLVVLKKNTSVFRIDSAGAGCLMIRRSVFNRIHNELHEGPFDITPPYGEDHSFFLRLRKLKIKAYCNPHIECKHLSWRSLSLSDLKENDLQLMKRNDIHGFK